MQVSLLLTQESGNEVILKKDLGSRNGDDRYKYSCSQCDKQYIRKDGLDRHMEIHTGQFTFYCQICRKGFSFSNHYEAHIRGHQGLKYHCDYCSKPFKDKQKYRYHLSVHTGQYRFKCDTCGEGFNVKKNYEAHTTLHG